jgi:hypothetical protein
MMMISFIPKLKLLVLPCLFWLATPEDCHQLDEVGFEPIQKSFRNSQLSKKDRRSYLRIFRNVFYISHNIPIEFFRTLSFRIHPIVENSISKAASGARFGCEVTPHPSGAELPGKIMG